MLTKLLMTPPAKARRMTENQKPGGSSGKHFSISHYIKTVSIETVFY
jgi:hypothetical protein